MKIVQLVVLGVALFQASAIDAETPSPGASETVVVYNSNDPSAKELADFYCSSRGIDPLHEISVSAPMSEEISREEYDKLIARPIRETLIRQGYWLVTLDMMNRPLLYASTVRYVALIRGFPLKVRQCSNYPGDAKMQPDPYGGCNAASVDSELSVLGLFSPQISGILHNPLYKEKHMTAEEGDIPPGMLFVSRLDAPSDEAVRTMIRNGIQAEHAGLWGWGYIDLRSVAVQGYAKGDQWIREAGNALRRHGIPVLSDDLPQTLQPGFPVTDAAAYYGWYSENIDGPFADPNYHFIPGAVAVHLHSYSAASLRDATKGWSGPLVEHGATATLGNVYEPYLPFTTDLGVFASALLSGRNLAESYYAAQPVLSWMTICVGDPLYRPYASLNISQSSSAENPWWEYRQIILAHDGDTLAAAEDLKSRAEEKKESLYLEGLGAAQLDAGECVLAEQSFHEARTLSKNPQIIFRLLLEESRAMEKQGLNKKSSDLLKEYLADFPQADQQRLLKAWIKRLETQPLKPAA
jgi:uncharacterized protein (TIGR03790 family)